MVMAVVFFVGQLGLFGMYVQFGIENPLYTYMYLPRPVHLRTVAGKVNYFPL